MSSIRTKLTFRRYNLVECVQALVLAGANLNASTASGTSSLFIASYVGHASCVRVLLQAGADPHTGGSCVECAQSRGFPLITKMLSQNIPGLVEGFEFDSSAVLRKWARRFFLVSLSQGILFVNRSIRNIKLNLDSAASQPADGVNSMIARRCFTVQVENWEGKRDVLKFRSSDSSLPPRVSVAVCIEIPLHPKSHSFLVQSSYFAFNSEFSMQLMLRWLNLLGAQPFSPSVDNYSMETAAPNLNIHSRCISDNALLHVRSVAMDDALVPLLSSSDV